MSNGKGRVVLITGASSGIGLAAAGEFVKNGDIVYSLSRTAPPDPAVRFVQTDVTSQAQVSAAVETVLAEQHRIDVLVLNAGFGISGAVEFTNEEDAKRQLDVCFFGAFRAVKAALPAIRASKGTMLFISSVASGSVTIPFQTFYSAAKAAINALVLGLRGELRGTGVRVAALLPGDTKTGFTAVREKCEVGAELYPAMVRSIASMERSEQSGMDPARIGKKLVKLSRQRRPKPFSSVGPLYKTLLVLAKVLPARLVSCIVELIYAS